LRARIVARHGIAGGCRSLLFQPKRCLVDALDLIKAKS
jgi:hypothetical protein